jgi:hypothetical protein
MCIIGMTMASCTATKITSSWREPDKTVLFSELNKVLVVAMFGNETNRRRAEDQMVAYMHGKGVVSYFYLNDAFNKRDVEGIRQKIRVDGYDGAVTMRLVDVEKEKVYSPGTTSYPADYRNFSGYYYRNWFYPPGYYTMTKVYTIETNVYSIKEDRIIWSGLTQTTDPDGVKQLTEEVAKVVYKKMVAEGFIRE